MHPTWSPDESSIAFTEGEGQFSDLLVLDLSNDEVTAITDDEGARHPSWSRGEDTKRHRSREVRRRGYPGDLDDQSGRRRAVADAASLGWVPAALGAPMVGLAFGRDGDIWTWNSRNRR